MHEPLIAFSCDDVSPKTKVAKLKTLLKTIDRCDVKVTFFVVPKSDSEWDSCRSLLSVLKDAQGSGHEIALHGLSHLPFETGNPFDRFTSRYSVIRGKVSKGLKILNEKLETDARGFRAPYHHISNSLFRALDDLNFLYDSSKIGFKEVLLSYAPPLRAVWVSRKRGIAFSAIFHPLNLKLLEIPIAQEYTWYNLKFEVNLFKSFLKNNISKMEAGCLVINSHIGAISISGLQILKELFLCIKDMRLSELTLQEMARKHLSFETAKPFYA